MDPETIRWAALAAIFIAGASIYDRLGTLHDKAMGARLDHDRRLLDKLDAVERRLQAISLETHALPERIKEALEAKPLSDALAEEPKPREEL